MSKEQKLIKEATVNTLTTCLVNGFLSAETPKDIGPLKKFLVLATVFVAQNGQKTIPKEATTDESLDYILLGCDMVRNAVAKARQLSTDHEGDTVAIAEDLGETNE